MNESYLIIDALNLFIRCYHAYPNMNKDGEHIGGMIGFLKKTCSVSEVLLPSKIIVVWEGGGSAKRKALHPEYKMSRKPQKLNRFYSDEDMPNTEENKLWQIKLLTNLLKFFPVTQLYVQNCEADDVIGYMVQKFNNTKKTILSSDKDMYQLTNKMTDIWDLAQKKLVTCDQVFDTYRINPINFALAKSICGDDSDNIHGVKGVGFKNLIKMFPIMSSENEVSIDEVVNYSAAKRQESLLFERVASSKEVLEKNMKLIDLTRNTLSHDQIQRVDYQLNGHEQSNGLNLFSVQKYFVTNAIEFDNSLFEHFSKMSYFNLKKEQK
jgi:DNA polymerase-1